MANRIGARLASWVRVRDKVLATELFALGERTRRRRWSARGSCSPACSIVPGGLEDPDDPRLRSVAACRLSRGGGDHAGFEPIEGRAEQELVRRTLAS